MHLTFATAKILCIEISRYTLSLTQPENILWTTKDEEAVLKIADFGFAKLSSEQMMTTACGTPMFFSP
jgi:serine/threonine protein kinase